MREDQKRFWVMLSSEGKSQLLVETHLPDVALMLAEAGQKWAETGETFYAFDAGRKERLHRTVDSPATVPYNIHQGTRNAPRRDPC